MNATNNNQIHMRINKKPLLEIKIQKSRNIFSLTDHMFLSFLPCLAKCSKNLEIENEKFNQLVQYMSNYIDVMQMMRQFHELERLKLIILDRQQLSAFENIGIPEDPFSDKNLNKSNMLHVIIDELKQKNKINKMPSEN